MKKMQLKDCAADILTSLPRGILLTTKAEGQVNSMVIGWGTFGTVWNKRCFVAYVRESRYTRELLDKNPEFTVNVPMGDFDRNILAVCGAESGRDVDKIEKLGLTLVEPQKISVPAIKEFPLTLECKVLYRQLQDASSIPSDITSTFYPPAGDLPNVSGEDDAHFTYIAEIVDVYIAE